MNCPTCHKQVVNSEANTLYIRYEFIRHPLGIDDWLLKIYAECIRPLRTHTCTHSTEKNNTPGLARPWPSATIISGWRHFSLIYLIYCQKGIPRKRKNAYIKTKSSGKKTVKKKLGKFLCKCHLLLVQNKQITFSSYYILCTIGF